MNIDSLGGMIIANRDSAIGMSTMMNSERSFVLGIQSVLPSQVANQRDDGIGFHW